MYNEDFLKSLGFVEFEHLVTEKRDNNKRLSKILFVEDGCFTIRVIYINGLWEIERFSFEGDELTFSRYFPSPPTLGEIINKLFLRSISIL